MYQKKITGKTQKGQKNIETTHTYSQRVKKICSGNVGNMKVLRIMKKPTKTFAIHNKHKTCC